MGLFSRKKTVKFVPDLTKPDYDNWLDFLDCGGTSLEWEILKKENQWVFPESETEKFERYLCEVKFFADRYYNQMQEIQKEWSVLYNLGTYTGLQADRFEQSCIDNIANYKEMRRIDQKYGQNTATNVPAFRRLAMIYEKQGRFEEAADVCKQACLLGMDERSRMIRMIKKAGRKPTQEEQSIIEKA